MELSLVSVRVSLISFLSRRLSFPLSDAIYLFLRLGNNVRVFTAQHYAHRKSTRLLTLSSLRSSYSCVAYVFSFTHGLSIVPLMHSPRSVQRGGRVEIIANDQGHRITPSWVAFTDEERLCVLFRVFCSFSLVLTSKLGSVTRPKMHSTRTLPTRSSMPNVSSVVRWMSQSCSAILSIGEAFRSFSRLSSF